MADTYTSGAASIKVDDAAVIATLDRVSDGAASQFLARTDQVLDPLAPAARARWPVRTGVSRDGFVRSRGITENRVENRLENRASSSYGFYAYKIKWSTRTKQSLDDEAVREADKAMPYIRRGRSTFAQQRIAQWVLIGKPKRKGTKTARGSDFQGIPELPTHDTMTAKYRSRLSKRHGEGAPNEALAGKQPWRELVRKPAEKQEPAMVRDLEDAIGRLARGG